PSGYIREVVDRVTPSVLAGRHAGLSHVGEFITKHVNETVTQLRIRSAPIAERLAAGTLAIAGATYHLADGRVVLRNHLGDIGEG
ncbi:MAG TPA: carbonic anhydrase, partial [Mycobacterium sp.]|nr:carbonic anhydrase [Mycobacterium sp.]